MQLKRFLLWAILSIIALPIYAQTAAKHKVEKGETLYKIAVKYNVTIDALKAANPKVIKAGVKMGDTVIIPAKGKTDAVIVKLDTSPTLPNEKADLSKIKTNASKEAKDNNAEKTANASKKTKNTTIPVKDIPNTDKPIAVAETKTALKTLSDTAKTTTTTKAKPIKHKVGESETLYSIAKMYSQDISLLQTWNKLPDLTVKPGQDIIVEWVMPTGEALVKVANKPNNASKATATAATKTNTKALSPFERKFASVEKDTMGMYRKITQTGIATWFDDAGASASSGGNMYVLHRTAPLRSILKVTNPMNKKSVHVMVIERLPNTINNENVTMSLTKSAAKKLGILDEKSIVECKYYIIK